MMTSPRETTGDGSANGSASSDEVLAVGNLPDAEDLVAHTCATVGRIFGVRMHAVATASLRDDGFHRGVAATRVATDQGVRFDGATAVGWTAEDAVVTALLASAGIDAGPETVDAVLWSRHRDVVGLSTVGADGRARTVVGDGAMADTHRRLVATVPGPGVLSVTTGGLEHRVRCAEGTVVVVTTPRGSPVLDELDRRFAAGTP